MGACGSTPTRFYQEQRPLAAYALPRKRERGRTVLVANSCFSSRKGARSGLPSSLSRLRGRVARPSGRDGWGPTRARCSTQTFAE
jgi:hypothetical protein